jgi:aminopeptidase N
VLASSSRDVYSDVQSVQVVVNHPDEISTLFDPAIVYAKGGRLLKMMREYIGEQAFQSGLAAYFKKHQYKNTVGDDLWEEMSAASGKDIKAFMHPWLSQSGMPLVTVKQNKDSLTLTQNRFLLDKKNDTSIWPIPLLANQKLSKDLFDNTKITVEYQQQPVVINQNGSGHMVVQYLDEKIQHNLASLFQQQVLIPESRINILNDLFLLSRGSQTRLTEALNIVNGSSNEPRDAVWSIISRTISAAIGLTEGDESTKQQIYKFRRQLAGDLYKKLGWDDKDSDDPNTIGLRQTILSVMVASEDPHAVQEAKKRYESVKSVDMLPAEQRAMIIAAAVKNNDSLIDNLIEQHNKSQNPEIQLAISSGLTHVQNEESAKYLIGKALDKNGFVRPQDIFRWYAYLMRNPYSRQAAWEWQKNNWSRLVEMFGDSKSLDHFVVYSARPLNTKEWQNEFKLFFAPKEDMISLRRSIKVAYSEIEARVDWRNREEKALREYFQKI